MDRNCVFRRHFKEHAPEPIIRDGGNEVRNDRKLRAAECRGNGIAAERDGVSRGNVFLVAGRQPIGQERNIDIGLADEECVHGSFALLRSRVSYELEATTATRRSRKSSRKKSRACPPPRPPCGHGARDSRLCPLRLLLDQTLASRP